MPDDIELDLELIKKRAVSGVITFTVRTLVIQAFTFFATFLLTILLSPQIFGIFFVVSAIINIFVYFSDVGLAAALVQKKEKPTREDFVSSFTIQQIIVFSLVGIGLLFSAKIAAFYKLDHNGLVLLRVLIISLLFSSLKTIPSIILERELKFTKLVIPQVAENVVFYAVAVVLAYYKFGIAAFSWAVLTRGAIGLVLIYILQPWKPGIGISIKDAKKLVTFGVPFQINSILALLKDDLLTVFVGKVLPYSQVGYLGWSQKFAFVPLRFIMDNVIKITFPAYSRLQEHLDELKNAIEKSVFFVTFCVYPSLAGLVAIAPKVITIVPNYSKWEPTLPLLFLFGINAAFAAVNTTLTNTLFAIGKPKIVLNLMIGWTILTWLLTVLLIKDFGYIGVGAASAIVAASTSVIVIFIKREINIAVLDNIKGPLIASLSMLAILKFQEPYLPSNLLGLILMIIEGVLIYIVIVFAISRTKLTESFKVFSKSVRLKEHETN